MEILSLFLRKAQIYKQGRTRRNLSQAKFPNHHRAPKSLCQVRAEARSEACGNLKSLDKKTRYYCPD